MRAFRLPACRSEHGAARKRRTPRQRHPSTSLALSLGPADVEGVRRRWPRQLHRPSHRRRESSVPEERPEAPTTGISSRPLRSLMADMARRRTTRGCSPSCSERREEGPFVWGLPRRCDCANLTASLIQFKRASGSMSKVTIAGAPVVLGLSVAGANADTLPLPQNLSGFRTHDGEVYFAESDAREAYFPLASNFLTQKTQAYCGVASIVMVLNALGVPAPPVPEYTPYRTFTQDNVLNEQTDAVLPREVLARQGMTLDQIGGILATQPVKAEVHIASDSPADEFRQLAMSYLGEPGHFVIVNYLRKAIGEEIGGHISPLAAYDGKADRFLILDVARYKYPPVWVKASDLFDAMNTTDAVNDNMTRGYILISKIGTPAAAPVQ